MGNYELLIADGAVNNNDLALSMLLAGTADAMFVYADQAYNYKKACEEGVTTTCNCAIWEGFGTKFAYVQTGQFGYVNNGTTLAMAKKDSGVAAKLNPCLQKFMETKDYYDICAKYDIVDSCYRNSFFPSADNIPVHDYNKPTQDHNGNCSSGYCPCTAPMLTDPDSATLTTTATSSTTLTETVTTATSTTLTTTATSSTTLTEKATSMTATSATAQLSVNMMAIS